MALEENDWAKIYRAIQDALPSSAVVQGRVIRADPIKNLVWMKEFGDQPIPLFSFDYTVKYYDTLASGSVVPKSTTVKLVCPKVGDTVLVIKQHGSRRLPKCVGVLRSRDFIVTTE